MGTFLDFAYFSSYLLTKEIAWKRDDAIFSEPELIWSLLVEFWKILIKIKQLKSSMTVSLTQKLRAVECLSNSSGYLIRCYNFWIKNTINLIKIIIESSHEHLQNFILIQQASQKLRFTLFHNIFYEVNIPYLCKPWNYIS